MENAKKIPYILGKGFLLEEADQDITRVVNAVDMDIEHAPNDEMERNLSGVDGTDIKLDETYYNHDCSVKETECTDVEENDIKIDDSSFNHNFTHSLNLKDMELSETGEPMLKGIDSSLNHDAAEGREDKHKYSLTDLQGDEVDMFGNEKLKQDTEEVPDIDGKRNSDVNSDVNDFENQLENERSIHENHLAKENIRCEELDDTDRKFLVKRSITEHKGMLKEPHVDENVNRHIELIEASTKEISDVGCCKNKTVKTYIDTFVETQQARNDMQKKHPKGYDERVEEADEKISDLDGKIDEKGKSNEDEELVNTFDDVCASKESENDIDRLGDRDMKSRFTGEIVKFDFDDEELDASFHVPDPKLNNYILEGGHLEEYKFRSSVSQPVHNLFEEQQFENYRNLYEELEEHDAVNFDTFVVENLSNKPTLSQSSSISSINQRFESCPIDCLPDEIMVKIFSHLSTKDLCLSCALVCGRWRNLTLDHSLWLELDFRHCPNLPTIQFLRIVRKAPLLRRLFISDRTNLYPPELAIVLESCPHLCEIDIGFCDKITCELINCLASYAQNLTHINVEGCNYFDEGCVENLVKLKRLSHLNLSHCTAIQDQGLMLVAKRLEKIVNINLDGMNFITDRGVIRLVSEHSAHLEALELDGAEITDNSIQHIAECRCLKHLAMSFCESLTDRSLEYIRKCVNLEYLRLRKGSDFTTEGLTRFFTTVKLVHLQVLNLSECTAINDAVVLNIVQMCGLQLKELALSWCWDITDTGLISIVDHCGRLEQLDLVGLDKIRGECLTRISEEMPRLIFLDLRQCNKIMDDLVIDVVRCKPDLKVINYYGEEYVYE
ncbi:uncharacterized protein LOC128240101 [Mya arenaria]|uniref:uncharacterized protein LOC128240101 n=1 Tax=Mya arenaria TaxID=6604 RepID=UPI0022E688BD|nr:uncharacterized protein LOC128240101 [Mya arenaria]XP_052812557.1 uncharacterized protein LOC128240101 [Mya arenaria]